MSNPEFALAESVTTTNASIFIAIYLLVLIYCCFGLAVVCDVYFVPALQKLSYTYDLPPDIAGSTLMALGASVPELFASLIGVFVTEDDIGTGSIIGSSCFNLIAVPAACAFVASASFTHKLTVSPVPVIRNSAFYSITILVLLLIIKDNKVDVPEAVILLLFFVMYMAFMIFCAQSKSCNGKSQQLNNHQASPSDMLNSSYISTDSAIGECQKGATTEISNNNATRAAATGFNYGQQAPILGQFYFSTIKPPQAQQDQSNEFTPLIGGASGKGFPTSKSCGGLAESLANNSNDDYGISYHQQLVIPSAKNTNTTIITTTTTTANNNNKTDDQLTLDSVSIDLGIAIRNNTCLMRNVEGNEGKHIDEMFEQHENSWLNSNWVLIPMLPLTLSLKLLTPLKFKNTCWTIWTFLVSICLIGGLTYVSVWMVHLFGQSVGLPETVAGMTILSWGTGIPELIASIVLIKKTAQADMAICNTIGSNVIDASFCLSVPWIVKCLLNRAEGLKPEVAIQSAALPWTSFTLLLSVVLLLVILKLHNWELGFSVGVWLMLTYFAFVGVATYLESTYSASGLDLFALI